MRRCAWLLTVLVIAAACGDEPAPPTQDAPTDTAVPVLSPTPEPSPPFSISDPIAWSEAVAGPEFDTNAWFIFDVESGRVQVLRDDYKDPCPSSPFPEACVSHGGIIGVHWVDADTLVVVPFYGQGYLLDLDGRARIADKPPTFAVSPTGGGVSADGLWQASVTAVDGPGVVVGTAGSDQLGGEPRFMISYATFPRWSPAAPDTVALITDDCARFHLSLFEPDSGDMSTVSAEPHEIVIDHAWQPDGSTIAAGVAFAGESQTEPRSEIVLIDVPAAFLAHDAVFARHTLGALTRPGLMVPVGWNADGTRLLVRHERDRDICSGGVPGGTKVQPLPR